VPSLPLFFRAREGHNPLDLIQKAIKIKPMKYRQFY